MFNNGEVDDRDHNCLTYGKCMESVRRHVVILLGQNYLRGDSGAKRGVMLCIKFGFLGCSSSSIYFPGTAPFIPAVARRNSLT